MGSLSDTAWEREVIFNYIFFHYHQIYTLLIILPHYLQFEAPVATTWVLSNGKLRQIDMVISGAANSQGIDSSINSDSTALSHPNDAIFMYIGI